MKRKFTFLLAALLLMSGLSWAQTRTEITWTASEQGYENGQVIESVTFDSNVSGTFDKGTNSNAPKYYTSGTAIRCYGGNYFTISATTGNLTSIAMTFSSGEGTNAITTNVGSYENGTWSGEAQSVTFTIGGTTGHRRIASFTIDYSTEAATVALPVFNPASGTEFGDEGLEVTITCATDNTTIYYTLDGSEPDDESTEYTGAISLTETTTIKAVAYDSDDNTSAVATATYTYVDPNQPGTQANPYTVAQARAAIDAGTGTQGVYATGIVSAIPTAYSTQYNNITFNMVDEAGDEVFLQAYRCGGDLASEVAVGDVAVVYGSLTKYGSTYEFSQGCQVVSLTHPSILAPAFSIAAGGYAEAQSVELSCETPNAVIYYTLDGSDPTSASTQYNGAISVTETTTIKAIAYVGAGNSPVAEAAYYILSDDNVYTVTDALAFTSYPQNNIFVSGIVSTAPESLISNAQLTYFISVDGEATNELEVYKGRGMNDAAFTSVDDIQVGDIVTVFGNVQEYQGTIEFGSGNYLVTFERPDAPVVPSITVADATVSVPAEGGEGTLTVTYENFTEIIADVYFCNAEGEAATYEWITAEINEDNNVEYLVGPNEGEARTAYFKVYALDDNAEEVYSNLVTVNQAEYVAPALDYAELPFEFDGGRADIATTDGLTQDGLDSDYGSSPKLKFNTTGDWVLLHFNERPGTLTFDIKGNTFSGGTFTVQTSEDGVTYTDLENYTDANFGNTIYSEEFTNLGENVRYIKWIYTEKSSGNVALGNITLAEYTGPVASIIVADATVSAPAEGAEGTLTVTYENISEIVADVYFCDANGQEFTYEWMTAEIDDDNNVEYLVEPNDGEARTAYFKVYALDDNAEVVYSNLVTVNQAAPVVLPTGNQYALYTGDLVEGDYLIVYQGKAMNHTVSSNRLQYEEITPNNDVIVTDNEAIVWHIAPSATEGYWTIYSADAEEYAASTGTKNQATMLADGTDDKALWIVSDSYEFVNKYNSEHSINSNLRNNGTYGFACYAPGTGGALSLYKKVETLPANTIVINGYGTSTGGYYLIASPFQVNPSVIEGMTDGEFDLYYFDESQEDEWINYEGEDGGFDLVPGKGYLYAHSTDVTLTFEGEPYNGEPIFLAKTAGAQFEGWNLVGNPYTETAHIDRDFYVMKEDGTEIITGEGNEIAAMQGFFVIAAEDGEELTFTDGSTDGEKIVMNVNSNRGIVDRAMVRFGEGRTLPKFQLNEGSTKLYIAEGEEEYAVVRSINENSTPVSFRAAENGTYTLSINAENVEMEYLHLIDNMTGADIDLLATPSYSFEARTTDYANRFNLVYATYDDVNEDNAKSFAYFNGSEWVIDIEGEATLQVVDINGRMLSSMTVSNNANISINQPAGIYMLRLVNGDNVKVQKVVVR